MEALTFAMLIVRDLKEILNFVGMVKLYRKWNDLSERNLVTLIANFGKAKRCAFLMMS